MSHLISIQKYQGVEIAYDEAQNKWVFELRGRERSVESLAKAKEAIDKPVPKEKDQFEKIKAHFRAYHGWNIVEVTSQAERGCGSSKYFWVMDGKTRSKETGYNLFPMNEHNDPLVAEHKQVGEQMKALRKQQVQIEAKLKSLA